MNNKKFIITTSEETAEYLLANNFQFINYNEGQWVFINKPEKVNFNEIKKAVFTNKIFI